MEASETGAALVAMRELHRSAGADGPAGGAGGARSLARFSVGKNVGTFVQTGATGRDSRSRNCTKCFYFDRLRDSAPGFESRWGRHKSVIYKWIFGRFFAASRMQARSACDLDPRHFLNLPGQLHAAPVAMFSKRGGFPPSRFLHCCSPRRSSRSAIPCRRSPSTG